MRHARNYHILIAIAFLQGMVFYAPVATRYRLDFGIDLRQFFVIESISWILTIALEIPFGVLADRYGCRRIILAGNLMFALSKLVFAVASGFALFMAERVLLSLSLAALSGASESFLAASVGDDRPERSFGVWNASSTAGLLLAALVSPLVYGISLRFAAYATILPYTAAALLSLFLVDPGLGAGEGRPIGAGLVAGLRGLLHDGALVGFLLVGALVAEYAQVATIFLSQLQYERAGIATPWFGFLFALIQLASLASAGAGRLVAFLGRRRALVAIVAASFLCATALALTRAPLVSVAALLITAVASSLYRPISTVIQLERIGTRDRATALSINAMLAEAAAAIADLGEGVAARASIGLGFAVFAIALGLVLLFSFTLFRIAKGRGFPAV